MPDREPLLSGIFSLEIAVNFQKRLDLFPISIMMHHVCLHKPKKKRLPLKRRITADKNSKIRDECLPAGKVGQPNEHLDLSDFIRTYQRLSAFPE
jgi:hypothetical protein